MEREIEFVRRLTPAGITVNIRPLTVTQHETHGKFALAFCQAQIYWVF